MFLVTMNIHALYRTVTITVPAMSTQHTILFAYCKLKIERKHNICNMYLVSTLKYIVYTYKL